MSVLCLPHFAAAKGGRDNINNALLKNNLAWSWETWELDIFLKMWKCENVKSGWCRKVALERRRTRRVKCMEGMTKEFAEPHLQPQAQPHSSQLNQAITSAIFRPRCPGSQIWRRDAIGHSDYLGIYKMRSRNQESLINQDTALKDLGEYGEPLSYLWG